VTCAFGRYAGSTTKEDSQIPDRCISMQIRWNDAMPGVSEKDKIKKASIIIYIGMELMEGAQ
jgi:hypothetical protein